MPETKQVFVLVEGFYKLGGGYEHQKNLQSIHSPGLTPWAVSYFFHPATIFG